MTKIKVYSYLRFSDVKQASGSSIDRQVEFATRWANERGIELDTSLSMRDEGLSAYHQKHIKTGALGVFLQAVDEGKIAPGSILIVEGLDRLSRAEPILAQAQLAQIVNAGITVVTSIDGKEYNRERLKAQPMDLVYSLIVMIRAHEESDTKSKRVKASVRKLCQRWIDGTYRGVIRNGKNPAWVTWTGERFELVPERADAMRKVIRLWMDGHGFASSMLKMQQRGEDMRLVPTTPLTLYRTLRNPMLIGTRTFDIDGEIFELENYYPALIDLDTWNAIQTAIVARHRPKGKGVITSFITGMGIAVCGYCGHALMSQNLTNRPKKLDGTPQDGHRRINCSGGRHRCEVSSSCSSAPVEKALLTYCSDQFNLDRLMRGEDDADPAKEANAALAAIRQRIAGHEKKLDKLTDAMMADTSGATPLTFVRKARELEDELASMRQAESEAATSAAKATIRQPAQARAWKDLAKAALAMDDDARMKVRKMVADTFEKIVIYNTGVIPGDTRTSAIDMVLIAKGGHPRMLRINRRSGDLIDQEDFSAT